ncbi:rRNA pseudouridine synthase [Vallitalea pronyensis]|uniref:Pseudouridine synthase n=1 Tax=Vallitalea pronyensis TaxID=1348613 RepID=A0A8J8MKD3_9FIRM|nr:pseudouridine synthase [Vallitalea pronyensis]QUI23089.1 rRNA pseudouridine synthase [Vallitalea pronyensis]
MEIRLQKYLADAGIASRRKSEILIQEGMVTVNGRTVKALGTKINPQKDIIKYEGKVIKQNTRHVYFMLNKPTGYITTVSDEKGRKTVMDLIDYPTRLYPIGRLDYNTSGLLLLTNDGDLTYRLTHPKHEVEKKYLVTIKGVPTEKQLGELRKGVNLGVYKTSRSKIRVVDAKEGLTTLQVCIHEGKNRQVRRMFEHIGFTVTKLKRTAIGRLTLSGLKHGKYRPLTKEEIHYLRKL